MLTIFYSSSKVLCDYAVPPGTTIKGELYRWVLIHKLRPAVARKQPHILEDGLILLHDGSGPHRAASVVQMLTEWDWEVLAHPPYSPCDFHLFAALKEPLRGVRFDCIDDINDAVSAQLRTLQKDGLRNGVLRLPQRWQSTMDKLGEYIESEK